MEMRPFNTEIIWTKNQISGLDNASSEAKPETFDEEKFADIERLAHKVNRKGKLPLWDGYLKVAQPVSGERSRPPWRTSNEVRTTASVGRFFSWLAYQRRPLTIVEFGTAFGVSGMYWLRGLELIGQGVLYTFEPNKQWRAIAVENLRKIGDRFVSIEGTFEDNIDLLPLPSGGIDIAFVDAIHTSDFVYHQVEMLKRIMSNGALIVLDDINFSDDMRACWADLSQRDDVAGSAEGYGRIGIIEYLAKN